MGKRIGTDDAIAVEVPGEEWDPVTAAAIVLGRKWHSVVLGRLLSGGPLGFSELARSIDGLSNKVLSACLEDLEEKELVTRRVASEKPYRVEYGLTEEGESLRPVIAAMGEWGETAVQRAESREAAAVIVP